MTFVEKKHVLIIAGRPAHLTGEMDVLPAPLGCGFLVGAPQEEHNVRIGGFALRRGGELSEEVGGGRAGVAAQDNSSRPNPAGAAAPLGGRGHRGEASGGGGDVVDEVAAAGGRA
jgi:hypothetical protein